MISENIWERLVLSTNVLGKYERRSHFLLPICIGGIFTQIPLLNGLGYEAAAFAGIYIHLRILFGGKTSGKERCWKTELLRNYWFYLQEILLICLILIGNSIFVPKCDWNTGFWFWGVIPPVTIWISLAIVDFSLSLSKKWGWWIARFLSIGNLLLFLLGLAFQPPIIGFSWSFGWFAGSIYDEALSSSLPVFLYRCSVFLQGLILLLFVQFQIDRGRYVWREKVYIPLFLLSGVYLLYFSQRQNWDIDHNQASVQKELGGRLETEHFIAYFDNKSIDFQEQFWLREDLEFRYWELQKFFDEDPVAWRERKIEVFIYPNRKIQQRLMGSRHTLVARPWTHQMHVRWEFGEDVIAHELAHLFTAPFADSLSQLSTQSGIWPNLGLIEGVAVAADWGAKETNAHEVSATLIEIGKAPDLLEIISPENFWRQPAGKAYQMMGSFTTWLIDEYGIEKFKKAYTHSEFQDIYGKSIKELYEEWFEFIKTIPVSSDLKEMTLFRYEKPTIFEKVCARAIAEERRVMRNSLATGDIQKARLHIEKMLVWESNNWRHHYSFAEILLEEDQTKMAEKVLMEQIDRGLSISEKAHLQEKLADIWWKQGKLNEAKYLYQELQNLGLSVSSKRKLAVKEYFTINPSKEGFEKEYFLDKPSFVRRLWLTDKISETESLGHYLLNFNLYSADEFELVIPITDELPPAVQAMNWRIELKSAWRNEKFDQVEKLIQNELASADNENRILAKEYQSRLFWKRSVK